MTSAGNVWFSRSTPRLPCGVSWRSLSGWRTRGLPLSITVDGPEFDGQVLDGWTHQPGVRLNFIRPGKPVENAHLESFNGRFREECLNEHWFLTMAHTRHVIEKLAH